MKKLTLATALFSLLVLNLVQAGVPLASASQSDNNGDLPGHSNPDQNTHGPERDADTDDPATEQGNHPNNGCGNDSDRLDDNEGKCGNPHTASPSPEPSTSPNPVASPSASPEASPSPSASPSGTGGSSPSPSSSPSSSPEASASPSASPTGSSEASPSASASPSGSGGTGGTDVSNSGGNTNSSATVASSSGSNSPGTGGEVLGATTLGGTGTTQETVGQALLLLGSVTVILSLYGYRKATAKAV